MIKKIFTVLALFFLCTKIITAQSHLIDSLKNRLKSNLSTEDKILTTVNLSWELANYDLQQALDYLNKITPKELKSVSSRYISDYYNAKGVIFARLFKKDSAEKYFKLDLKENLKQNNTKRIFDCYYDLANLYQYFNSLDTTLEYLNKTENFYRSSKMDNPNLLARLYYTKAIVFNALSALDSSLDYSIKALELFEKLKDNYGIYLSLMNNAKIFGSLKQPRKAFEALKRIEKLDLERTPEQQGFFYKLYANVYADLDSTDQAFEMYKKAINSFLHQKNDKMALLTMSSMLLAVPDKITSYWLKKYDSLYTGLTKTNELAYNYFSSLANFYMDKGNYEKAYILLDSSEKYVNNDINKFYNIKNKALVLTKLKKYKQATDLWQNAMNLYDSVLSEKMRTKINELNIKYQTAKKDQQIALQKQISAVQQAKIRQQKTLLALIFVTATLIIILLIGFIFYKGQKQKRKILEMKIDAEQQIKKEIARELHSSLGSDLTAVILALKEKLGDTRETETIVNIYNHIRRASHLLSLPDFITTTLEDEINSLSSDIQTSADLNIETNIYSRKGWSDVSPDIQRKIYSIVRELFLNSMKHADAKNISLQITRHDKYIYLNYEDDGKGYDPKTIEKNKGYKDMQELTRLLHGTFIDDSQPQNGTVLTFKFPIQ